MNNLPTSAKVFVIGLALVAAVLGAFLLAQASVPHGERLLLALILTALMAVTNWRIVFISTDNGLSLGFTAAFAALLLFDAGIAVAIAFAGTLVANLLNRHSFSYTLFDLADVALATGGGGLVLSFSEGSGASHFESPAHLLSACATALTMYLINTLDWTAVFALRDGRSWFSTVREQIVADTIVFFLESTLGFFVAMLVRSSAWELILLAIPGYVAYSVVEQQVRVKRRDRESLMRTEARLAEAQRIAHVGSWEWVENSEDMMWSDEIYRILGYEPQGCLATPQEHLMRVHPEDRERVRKTLEQASATGESFELEYRVVRPSGEERFVYLKGEVERNDENVRIFGTLLDITERKILEQRLEYQAYHDVLTGLPNRALFTDRLEIALSRARRHGRKVAVMFLDLDGFKQVNDELGHESGDDLLREIAGRLSTCLRAHDTVARLGGDEFVMLLDEADEILASSIAGRVIQTVQMPHLISGRRVQVNASIGIALGEGEEADRLLRRADIAMYEAKRGGRGRYRFYSNPDDLQSAASH